MKKTLFILGFATFALAGCVKDNLNGLVDGKSYIFEGTVETDGFTWTSTSELGVYALTQGVVVRNDRCLIEGWSPQPPEGHSQRPYWKPSQYEGKSVAPFNTNNIKILGGENEFFVFYPYTAGMTFVTSERTIYDLSIAYQQKIEKPDAAAAPASIGIVKGNSNDEKFNFSLKPVSAVLKLNISTAEFAGYKISKLAVGVKEGALSGYVDVNIDSLTSKVNKTNNSVTATISNTSALVKDKSQSFCINTFAGDYSAVKFDITITMADATTTVILPIKKTGVKLEAGKVTDLDIVDLKSSDNSVGSWYCPVEARQLSGQGYAYGQANTFLIQSKSVVYDGATLTPDPNIPESVTIDYRVRGEYKNAESPEGVTFEWATTNAGTKNWTSRGDKAFDSNQFTFTQDAANHTVTVTNNGSFAGAPILLMKKGDKILWGWAFWTIAADGTVIEPVNIGGYDFINLAIGIPSTKYEEWLGISGNSYHSRPTYYYQWGRYLPIFWNYVTSLNWVGNAEGQGAVSNNGNIRALNGPYATLEEALTQPAGVIAHVGSETMANWIDEDLTDLWGGTTGSPYVTGKKTIYDPCPKGWRVPDMGAVEAMEAYSSEITYETTSGRQGCYVNGSFFGMYGFYEASKALATAKTSLQGYQILGTWTAGKPSYYWTNYNDGTEDTAKTLVFLATGSETVTGTQNQNRANAFPVRCQKDTDNR